MSTVNFESAIVGPQRGLTRMGGKFIHWGISTHRQTWSPIHPPVEGFGNAFLEAIYYKRPLVVNNYSIYEADIKPKGFKVIEFDGFISETTLEHARHMLTHPRQAAQQCEYNYELARRYLLVQHA